MIVCLSLKTLASKSRITILGAGPGEAAVRRLARQQGVVEVIEAVLVLERRLNGLNVVERQRDLVQGAVRAERDPRIGRALVVAEVIWIFRPARAHGDLKLVGRNCQLEPPSKLTPTTWPLAPPFDHRSCCHIPTRLSASVGLTSIQGLDLAVGENLAGLLLHLDVVGGAVPNGLVPETWTRLPAVNGAAPAEVTATAKLAAIVAVRTSSERRVRFTCHYLFPKCRLLNLGYDGGLVTRPSGRPNR